MRPQPAGGADGRRPAVAWLRAASWLLATPVLRGQNAPSMRVLLLNPPGPAGRPFVREGRCEQRLSSYAYRMLPISLPSTAGAVRAKGHQVSIVDACGPRDSASTLEDQVRSRRPELVVVSVSTPTYETDVETIG